MGALPQGNNQVEAYIPVARITDMLNNPNGKFDYNGQELRYPDIKLIYWAGGNPFHHHQDLNRLRKAWEKPDTIIVNDSVWTATARHADIVFPCTTVLERNDFGGSSHDCYISPMRQAVNPYAESKNDYDIFLALAAKLGFEDGFSEDRDEMGWIRHLYGVTRGNAAKKGVELPGIEEFWNGEQISVAEQVDDAEFILENFRKDPLKHPLGTPSGRIEIFSETIDAFAYDDCQGYPRWYEHEEWLGSDRSSNWPLHLVSNQPKTRLHSQLDHGITSRKHKIKDRERARMNPGDAAGRNIANGDVVRVFNDRGACLAGIELSDSISRGVIELPTGAMFDPVETADGSLEVHGNPNVLTRDHGTSKLAQGPTAHSCLVEVELFGGELPAVTAYTPPGETVDR
jgi:biotin/methionine sulfoxide reductase